MRELSEQMIWEFAVWGNKLSWVYELSLNLSELSLSLSELSLNLSELPGILLLSCHRVRLQAFTENLSAI